MPTPPEVHPAAAVWPMLPEDELRDLADSIAEVGLLDPLVVTPDGLLLDGRNRLAACELAGVEPTWVTYDGDPTTYVVAKANARRHMGTGARAMAVAVNLAAAGKRQENGRWERGAVPELTRAPRVTSRAWTDAMQRAGLVLDYCAELAPDVVAGTVALTDAADKARTEQRKAKAEADRLAALPDDLRVLVRERVRDLPGAEAEAGQRRRLAKLAPDLAERVRNGDDTIDSAEAAMREGLANIKGDRDEAARIAWWLRHAGGYPLAPVLREGYRTAWGEVEPLDPADLAALQTAVDALPKEIF